MKEKKASEIESAAGEIECALRSIAKSITPVLVGSNDASGTFVESLTEAVCGITKSICNVADAIHELAEAVKEVSNQRE